MIEDNSKFANKSFEDLELIKKKELGKGGYASVRLGKLRGDPTLYAVKIVCPIFTQIDLTMLSSKEHDHMRKEIKTHSMMSHPNIIRFYHLIENDEKLYMLLEYAPNGDLYKYIVDKERFSEKDACKIVAQVALALQYVHKKGVLHRDLKPENILLDSNFVVKVSDFGWCGEYLRSHRNSGQTPTHRVTFCGTYEYMAPEVIKGDHQDEKVDVWSLGILLYELLHGKTPFRSNAPLEIQRNIIEGRFNIDKRLSPAAIDLLRRVLRANAADRYSVKQFLAHPFVRVAYILTQTHIPNIQDFFFEEEPELTESPLRALNRKSERENLQANESAPQTTRMTTERMRSGKKEPVVDIQSKLTGLISKSKSKIDVENRTTNSTSTSFVSEMIVGKLSEKSPQAGISINDSPVKVRDSEPAKGTQLSSNSPTNEIIRNHSMEKTGSEINAKKKLETLKNQILNQNSSRIKTIDSKVSQSTSFRSGELNQKPKIDAGDLLAESSSATNIFKLAMSPKQSERKTAFFVKAQSPTPSIFKSTGTITSRFLGKSEADGDKLKVLVQTINQSLNTQPLGKRGRDRVKENKSIDGKLGTLENINKTSADVSKLFEKGSAQNRKQHSPDPKEIVAAVILRVKNSAKSNIQTLSSLLTDKKSEPKTNLDSIQASSTITERTNYAPKITAATLKKDGATASNKSLSLLESLSSQLQRKLSNSSLVKQSITDRRDTQTSRSKIITAREQDPSHTRNDSQATSNGAGVRTLTSQDKNDKVNIYSQPTKRSSILSLLAQTRPRLTSQDLISSSIKRPNGTPTSSVGTRVHISSQNQPVAVVGKDTGLDSPSDVKHNIYKK